MEQGKVARILITRKCTRKCSYCCNNYTKIMQHGMPLTRFENLSGYKEYCLTGGEPLLEHTLTETLAKRIKENFPCTKTWLYTSLYEPALCILLRKGFIDGVHYTIHQKTTEEDILNFGVFQSCLQYFPGASFRLYIHKDSVANINIIPSLWNRIEIKKWSTEKELLSRKPKGLPIGEDLFFLSPEFR